MSKVPLYARLDKTVRAEGSGFKRDMDAIGARQ